MKARNKDSNDELEVVAYTQLKGSDIYDQVDEEKHWQDVRERAAIAAMQGLAESELVNDIHPYTGANLGKVRKPIYSASKLASMAVEYADELVKQLKGE